MAGNDAQPTYSLSDTIAKYRALLTAQANVERYRREISRSYNAMTEPDQEAFDAACHQIDGEEEAAMHEALGHLPGVTHAAQRAHTD